MDSHNKNKVLFPPLGATRKKRVHDEIRILTIAALVVASPPAQAEPVRVQHQLECTARDRRGVDRCFTGRGARAEGAQGFEASKAESRMFISDPAAPLSATHPIGGCGKTVRFVRLPLILGFYYFTGKRCPMKNGKQGHEAMKGGVIGCSKRGRRCRTNDAEKSLIVQFTEGGTILHSTFFRKF